MYIIPCNKNDKEEKGSQTTRERRETGGKGEEWGGKSTERERERREGERIT